MKTQIRLEIDVREPFAESMEFGDTGPYERLSGHVHFAIDPGAQAYQGVVDLEYAPRNTEGLVEYSSEFYMLKPVDLLRGNRRLIYDVLNRGQKLLLQYLNDAVQEENPCGPDHAGNGFLMRRGYSIVWSAWQGDILPVNGRMVMKVPRASVDGEPILGVVRTEFAPNDFTVGIGVPESGLVCIPLSGNHYTVPYDAATPETASATLTYREYETDARTPIPAGEWQFAKLDAEGDPVTSPNHCYLPVGFKPGWIYELIYTAKDPLVLGLGFTCVRDFISFLLHQLQDQAGRPNPLVQRDANIEKAYGWGCSQSARFLREFVYRGFNEDEEGKLVFSGVSPFVSGGGRVTLNYRFAQPGRYPRKQYDHLYPSDQFPFAYPVISDPLTCNTDGILKRPETDPLVIHTQTSSEYWQRRGSLVHTDIFGNDLPDHEKSRVYLFSSAEHAHDPLLGPEHDLLRHPTNPLNVTAFLRALQDALDLWATDGISPPESHVPRIADESLVSAKAVREQFPSIPGVEHPSAPNRVWVQDHGPGFVTGIMSVEPPAEGQGKEYPVLVPQVDDDGNEKAGIRGPDLEAPLATYTGWNYRPKGMPDKIIGSVSGSYLPFPRNRAKRVATGDSRPSIEERYRSRAHYVRAIAMAVQRLVEQRLLLQEDADRFVERAMNQEGFD